MYQHRQRHQTACFINETSDIGTNNICCNNFNNYDKLISLRLVQFIMSLLFDSFNSSSSSASYFSSFSQEQYCSNNNLEIIRNQNYYSSLINNTFLCFICIYAVSSVIFSFKTIKDINHQRKDIVLKVNNIRSKWNELLLIKDKLNFIEQHHLHQQQQQSNE
ncbi:unnamed protein product [Didymodactylos carnosus]|uniref:Transmembrane protein n=1 Tax=Didymodactylos carnosus TaxID=1234261 RepID=A0A814RIG7_9BILA|nr:unnamed protein product [Didymodactylos carnosus]CAF1389761.1 unnamed protein product [Didymodactylos carnosus]CAF3898112.1 unnamed protein product [Didymodactylos carnosus]CAF4197420.1 unnamed protein product [Didymodactylos carnosus]